MFEWNEKTIVVVELGAAGEPGLGYTYGSRAVAALVEEKLAAHVEGSDPMALRDTWAAMGRELRNEGRPGSAGWRSPPSTSLSGT